MSLTRREWHASKVQDRAPLWPTTRPAQGYEYPEWAYSIKDRKPTRLVKVLAADLDNIDKKRKPIILPELEHLSFAMAYALDMTPVSASRELLLLDSQSDAIFRLDCQLYHWTGPNPVTGLYPQRDARGVALDITQDSCWDCLIDGKKCDKVGLILEGPLANKYDPLSRRTPRSINDMLGLPTNFSVFTTAMQKARLEGASPNQKKRKAGPSDARPGDRKSFRISVKRERTSSSAESTPPPADTLTGSSSAALEEQVEPAAPEAASERILLRAPAGHRGTPETSSTMTPESDESDFEQEKREKEAVRTAIEALAGGAPDRTAPAAESPAVIKPVPIARPAITSQHVRTAQPVPRQLSALASQSAPSAQPAPIARLASTALPTPAAQRAHAAVSTSAPHPTPARQPVPAPQPASAAQAVSAAQAGSAPHPPPAAQHAAAPQPASVPQTPVPAAQLASAPNPSPASHQAPAPQTTAAPSPAPSVQPAPPAAPSSTLPAVANIDAVSGTANLPAQQTVTVTEPTALAGPIVPSAPAAAASAGLSQPSPAVITAADPANHHPSPVLMTSQSTPQTPTVVVPTGAPITTASALPQIPAPPATSSGTASDYDLTTDIVHKHASIYMKGITVPGHQYQFQPACDVPQFQWPDKAEALGLERWVPEPSQSIEPYLAGLTRLKGVKGNAPVWNAFMYTHKDVQCGACKAAGHPCVFSNWITPPPPSYGVPTGMHPCLDACLHCRAVVPKPGERVLKCTAGGRLMSGPDIGKKVIFDKAKLRHVEKFCQDVDRARIWTMGMTSARVPRDRTKEYNKARANMSSQQSNAEAGPSTPQTKVERIATPHSQTPASGPAILPIPTPSSASAGPAIGMAPSTQATPNAAHPLDLEAFAASVQAAQDHTAHTSSVAVQPGLSPAAPPPYSMPRLRSPPHPLSLSFSTLITPRLARENVSIPSASPAVPATASAEGEKASTNTTPQPPPSTSPVAVATPAIASSINTPAETTGGLAAPPPPSLGPAVPPPASDSTETTSLPADAAEGVTAPAPALPQTEEQATAVEEAAVEAEVPKEETVEVSMGSAAAIVPSGVPQELAGPVGSTGHSDPLDRLDPRLRADPIGPIDPNDHITLLWRRSADGYRASYEAAVLRVDDLSQRNQQLQFELDRLKAAPNAELAKAQERIAMLERIADPAVVHRIATAKLEAVAQREQAVAQRHQAMRELAAAQAQVEKMEVDLKALRQQASREAFMREEVEAKERLAQARIIQLRMELQAEGK